MFDEWQDRRIHREGRYSSSPLLMFIAPDVMVALHFYITLLMRTKLSILLLTNRRTKKKIRRTANNIRSHQELRVVLPVALLFFLTHTGTILGKAYCCQLKTMSSTAHLSKNIPRLSKKILRLHILTPLLLSGNKKVLRRKYYIWTDWTEKAIPEAF